MISSRVSIFRMILSQILLRCRVFSHAVKHVQYLWSRPKDKLTEFIALFIAICSCSSCAMFVDSQVKFDAGFALEIICAIYWTLVDCEWTVSALQTVLSVFPLHLPKDKNTEFWSFNVIMWGVSAAVPMERNHLLIANWEQHCWGDWCVYMLRCVTLCAAWLRAKGTTLQLWINYSLM